MNRNTLGLIAASLLTTSSAPLFAQTSSLNVVTTAVPMLRISADARAGGMGETGIAVSPDVNSVFNNLSKVPFLDKPASIGFTYTPWLKDIGVSDVYLMSGAGYYKIADDQAISTSFRYFSLGSIQFVDQNGNTLGSQSPREFAWDLGYSRRLSDKVGVAIALRYINSKLAVGNVNGENYQAGQAVSGDLSFYYNGVKEESGGWSFGAALTNLGTKINYTNDAQSKDYIPANMGLGAAYTKIFDEYNKITLAVDMNKLLVPTPPADETDSALDVYRSKSIVSSWFSSFGDAGSFSNEMQLLQFSVGAEYWYNNQFALRTGYYYESQSQGGRQYVTMGLGLKYQGFGLNFSYLVPSGSGTTRNPLSNTIRFGVIFDLGKAQESSGSSGK